MRGEKPGIFFSNQNNRIHFTKGNDLGEVLNITFNFSTLQYVGGVILVWRVKLDPSSCPPSLSPADLHTWYDTHLDAYLGVHGPVKDLSVANPDDRGRRFGVVSVAGEIERVTSPEAHHWSSTDDWVFWGNCG